MEQLEQRVGFLARGRRARPPSVPRRSGAATRPAPPRSSSRCGVAARDRRGPRPPARASARPQRSRPAPWRPSLSPGARPCRATALRPAGPGTSRRPGRVGAGPRPRRRPRRAPGGPRPRRRRSGSRAPARSRARAGARSPATSASNCCQRGDARSRSRRSRRRRAGRRNSRGWSVETVTGSSPCAARGAQHAQGRQESAPLKGAPYSRLCHSDTPPARIGHTCARRTPEKYLNQKELGTLTRGCPIAIFGGELAK